MKPMFKKKATDALGKIVSMMTEAVALAIVLTVALAVPAFAATPRSAEGYSFSSVSNYGYQLNAATDGTPIAGTKVTMWANTGSNTQRWDMNEYFPGTTNSYMKNAQNKNVVICYNGNAQAVLTTKSTSSSAQNTQAIRFINEGTGASGFVKYGLVLPAYLKAMTATGMTNGAQVQWLGSNGLTNQLWYIMMFN